jgi:hypothetical protein
VKAEWTISGPTTVTLGDDSVKQGTQLEQLGGAGLAQIEPLYGSAAPFMAMRGNVAGDCIFWAQKSHATQDAAATFFATEYARIGQSGSLVLTFNIHKLTMANAILKAVAKVNTEEAPGVAWRIRYSFGITTCTYS